MRKNNIQNEHFIRTSPNLMELKKGGGCIGCFGIPFFVAGIFMFLAVVQVIPFSNARELPWWSWILLFFMSAIFTSVGAALAFGRNWITINMTHRQIYTAWGLLKPMRISPHSLDDFDELVLKHIPGDSDTAETFPILLKSTASGRELMLCSTGEYGTSLEEVKQISNFVHLPINDITTDHPHYILEDEEAKVALNVANSENNEQSFPPPNLKSEISQSDTELIIRIKGKDISRFAYVELIIPIVILSILVWRILPFFRHTQTPYFVQYFFSGFIGLFFVLLPTLGVLKKILLKANTGSELRVSYEGIEILYHSNGKKRNLSIPRQQIIAVDYSTKDTALNAAMQGHHSVPSINDTYQRYKSEASPAPAWVRKISRWSRSKGVVIKSKSGLHYFGEGLAAEEILYLQSIIKRYLMERKKNPA